MNELRTDKRRCTFAYIQLMHAWPVSVVVVIAFLVALFATRDFPSRPWPAIGLVVLAVFLSQYCVGSLNEYIDRNSDRLLKPDKPIPSGCVPARIAIILSIITGTAASLVVLPLGLPATLLATGGTLIGLLYDLGLKRTPLSWLPYLLAFPLLPIWIFYALGAWDPVLLWLYLIAGVLIIGTHLANTLPDIEMDAANGEHGLAVLLGRRHALAVCYGAYLLAPLVALLPAIWHPYNYAWFLPGMLLSLALTAGSIGLYRAKPGVATLKRNWQLLTISAACIGAGWLGAVLF